MWGSYEDMEGKVGVIQAILQWFILPIVREGNTTHTDAKMYSHEQKWSEFLDADVRKHIADLPIHMFQIHWFRATGVHGMLPTIGGD